MDEYIFSKTGLINAVKGLRGISHPTRLQILCLIYQKKECTVSEIVGITGMSQSSISQHLSKMKSNSVLDDRRDGNRVFYTLNNSNYSKLIDALCLLYNKN
jgi:DNA-binding transcriptional ArsR family regulator